MTGRKLSGKAGLSIMYTAGKKDGMTTSISTARTRSTAPALSADVRPETAAEAEQRKAGQ